MRLRSLVLAGVLAGTGVGTAVALAADPTPTATTTMPAAAARTVPAAAVPAPTPIKARDVHETARQPDPEGGAPWVVRSFTTRERGRTGRCEQLGREVDGRFGWIVPGGEFRPAGVAYGVTPLSCGGGKREFRFGPLLARASLLGDAQTGVAAVAQSVTFGRLAPGTTSVDVTGVGRLTPATENVVLDVRAGGRLEGRLLRGTTRRTDGTRTRFGDTRAPARLRPRGRRPAPGTARVAVRTPDPAGGPAWGLLAAKARDGSTCLSAPGRLIGDQVGVLGPEPGVAYLEPFNPTPTCDPGREPTVKDPLRVDVAVFSYSDQNPSGSMALRRLDGRVALIARATADVLTVTFTTSRGVRTLVPDPRTHVAMDLYDGSFPGEQIQATARLRSGRTVTLVQSAGG